MFFPLDMNLMKHSAARLKDMEVIGSYINFNYLNTVDMLNKTNLKLREDIAQ